MNVYIYIYTSIYTLILIEVCTDMVSAISTHREYGCIFKDKEIVTASVPGLCRGRIQGSSKQSPCGRGLELPPLIRTP
jgi:hypothetical protein